MAIYHIKSSIRATTIDNYILHIIVCLAKNAQERRLYLVDGIINNGDYCHLYINMFVV